MMTRRLIAGIRAPRSFASITCFALFSTLAVSPVVAWNKAGHMTTAAIAYDTLKKDNPKALEKVILLLKQHPQFDKMWAKQLEKVDAADRDQALLMLAARWPDDIRDDPDYDHPDWHYIDFPFKPDDQPDSVKVAEPREPNAQTAFRLNVDVLEQKKSTPAEKAVALCWVFHLLGDVHQPLHSVSLFTTDFPGPKGDQGGTKMFIRAKGGANPITLHRFWDDLIGSDDDTREVKKVAIKLRTDFPQAQLDPQRRNVTPNDLPKWVQESFQSAKTDVYRQGKFVGSASRDEAVVCRTGTSSRCSQLPSDERRWRVIGWPMCWAKWCNNLFANLHAR